MRTKIRKLRNKKKRGTQTRALRFLLPAGSLIIFTYHAAGKADCVDRLTLGRSFLVFIWCL